MKLYEINEGLSIIETMLDKYAMEHEGDITDFPLEAALDELLEDRTVKLLNIAVFIKNLKAEAKAYGEEKKRLAAKESALNNKADRLFNYLSDNMTEGEKIEDVKASLGWRKSQKVVIECMLDTLPEEFVKTDVSARLSDLKAAINLGNKFDGVRIEECQNLQVK